MPPPPKSIQEVSLSLVEDLDIAAITFKLENRAPILQLVTHICKGVRIPRRPVTCRKRMPASLAHIAGTPFPFSTPVLTNG